MERHDGVSPVTRRTVECGVVDHDRLPLAVAASSILADIPGDRALAAAVFPVAQLPFARVLGQFTSLHPLFLVDSDEECLEWQRGQVGDRAVYLAGSVTDLPDALQGLGVVLNPFGLQHHLAEAPLYAPALRSQCRGDAVMLTLDWGKVGYPTELAHLPGIADEVHYAEQRLLDAFGPETGWILTKEQEIRYSVKHTIDTLATLLRPDHANLLRQAETQRGSSVVEVQSSIIYRFYQSC
jgi:hypothetical protein